jgi:hypothetical protein
MTSFHADQKVVCVTDFSPVAKEEWAVVFGVELPEKGKIYTIREIVEVSPEFEEEGYIGIRLKEILNMPNPCRAAGGRIVDREVVFHPQDFRPLQSKTADISVFTTMLTSSKRPVEA